MSRHVGRIAIIVIAALPLYFPTGGTNAQNSRQAIANAIRPLPGCTTNTLPANDDGSTSAIPLPFGINYFGVNFTEAFVNNNGNITFTGNLPEFTPFPLTTTNIPIIAPFFADVDTRGVGSGLVQYGNAMLDGRSALCVNWVNVGYYSSRVNKLNSFQLILIERFDTGPGNFDIEFNYDQVLWETGEASGGVNGLGGNSARAGYANGSMAAGTFLELQGSAVNGGLLDSNSATGLTNNSLNSGVPGRYVFFARNGGIEATPTATNSSTATATPTSSSTPTPTPITTATSTATFTATNTPTPTSSGTSTPTSTATDLASTTPTASPTGTQGLGIYADASIGLSGDITITPSGTPINTSSINVSTNIKFKGTFAADPATGVVYVTDAHPAGIYPVTVKAFAAGGTISRSFSLTVNTTPACSPLSFSGGISYPVGSGPTSIAVADFDSDGHQDIVSSDSTGFTTFLGDGTGDFTTLNNYSLTHPVINVKVGDFNADGKPDVVAALNSFGFAVLLGDGTGGFSPPVTYNVQSFAVAVADFNKDGRQDIIVTANQLYSIYSGDGNGGFGFAVSYATAIATSYLGDFNSDGNLDVATATMNDVKVLFGDAMGGFASHVSFHTPYNITSVAVGDLNGDGKQDVVSGSGSYVYVYIGDGLGGFTTLVRPSVPSDSIQIGDFNGDGNQDLVLASLYSASGTVSISFGDGTGGFSIPVAFVTGNWPNSVVVGDFNEDGQQDLATANRYSDSVSILLRECNSVAGNITYGNAIGNPPAPRYISNVTVTASGSNAATTTRPPGTGAGDYQLFQFPGGAFTITPSKTTAVSGINSFDAARIAQHVAGLSLLTTNNQRATADVTGNNVISSQDAAKIAQFAAGYPFTPPNLTGTWRFFLQPGPTFPIGSSPTSRSYSAPTGVVAGEDYVGLLIGDVSGNWNNTGARPDRRERLKETAIALRNFAVSSGSSLIVPVDVQGLAGKDVVSYEIDLRYDPSVIQPEKNAVDLTGTASRGLSVVTNTNEPGLLRVVVYGAYPIEQNGVLLNLRFTAVGAPGAVSPLTFDRIVFNEGDSGVSITDGQVELF